VNTVREKELKLRGRICEAGGERERIMDEQSGESNEKWWMKQMEKHACYQNEVDEEVKGVDFRDKVKHNERSDQLF